MSTKPPPSPIGKNISRLRSAAKLTQLQLAHNIGLHGKDAGAYICRIEGGQVEPRLTTLRRIAKAFNVPLGEILNTHLAQ